MEKQIRRFVDVDDKRKNKSVLPPPITRPNINTNDLFNISTDLYSSKSQERKEYEERVGKYKNNKTFKRHMKDLMSKATNNISFDIAIGDDDCKKLAFTETLRHCISDQNRRVVVKGYNIDGTYRYFTLSDRYRIEHTIGHIAGTLDLNEEYSDTDPIIDNIYAPVRYELLFLFKRRNQRQSSFTVNRQDSNNNIYEEEIEIDDDFRNAPDGGFFPYINLSTIDLSVFQIFHSVDKNNYKDNCFVYACIQSGVFSKDEIKHLRYLVRTRTLPNDKINQIAKQFRCHFVIRRIDESLPTKHQQQIKIDTRKKDWAKDYNRTVDLLLYKEHYMIYKRIPTTTYYLEHQTELDDKYNGIELSKRMLIRGMTKNTPKYADEGTLPMLIFRKMFELNLFKAINSCEMNILSTTEYNSHLDDYIDLVYNKELCCVEINNQKLEKKWTEIYYSDFETDVTVSPHKPYLNCTVRRKQDQICSIAFTGNNIAYQLLDYLVDGSLTYFHNLKYDSCFFVNEPGWSVSITERTGTVLQVVMTKYNTKYILDKNGKRKRISYTEKVLTFRNSYSIIPAPLRSFADMFKLNVHKEIMAYKLYTEHNIQRKHVSALEFQLQYYKENKENKSLHQIKDDWKQLIDNAKLANSFDDNNMSKNLMKYAQFYCKKDCVVLMKGMEKFNKDLMEVFNQTHTHMLNVHNYISVSAIGYAFAMNYGCFDDCYLLSGKPQDFIQRCVSGGRTMTANNKKQYVEG